MGNAAEELQAGAAGPGRDKQTCADGTCSSECFHLESAAPAVLSEFPSDTGSPHFKRFAQILLVVALAKSSCSIPNVSSRSPWVREEQELGDVV